MTSDASSFYARTVDWLLRRRILRVDMKILVVCGAQLDRDVLWRAGCTDVTISNLDSAILEDGFAPFTGSRQDAEALTYGNEQFDFCIAHNGLHHCFSPHRALLEMYRVAKEGVLVFEPRDSFLTRVGVRLNFGQDYETAAVAANKMVAGGVRDTGVPNYVYRWTEREVEKTIRSFSPWGRPRFLYRYGLRVPWGRLQAMNNRLYDWLVRCFLPILQFFFLCFPKQANGFAFVILKPQMPRDLHPWLACQNG